MKTALTFGVLVLLFCLALSCMSGSGDPEKGSMPNCGNNACDDDDDGDDDDNDASSDDDDDAGDDDDDNDDNDDDTGPVPDCDAIVEKIYDECEKELAEGLGDRLTKNQATNACEQGDDFWTCAEQCRQDNDDCLPFETCVNGCPGPYNLQ